MGVGEDGFGWVCEIFEDNGRCVFVWGEGEKEFEAGGLVGAVVDGAVVVVEIGYGDGGIGDVVKAGMMLPSLFELVSSWWSKER